MYFLSSIKDIPAVFIIIASEAAWLISSVETFFLDGFLLQRGVAVTYHNEAPSLLFALKYMTLLTWTSIKDGHIFYGMTLQLSLLPPGAAVLPGKRSLADWTHCFPAEEKSSSASWDFVHPRCLRVKPHCGPELFYFPSSTTTSFFPCMVVLLMRFCRVDRRSRSCWTCSWCVRDHLQRRLQDGITIVCIFAIGHARVLCCASCNVNTKHV